MLRVAAGSENLGMGEAKARRADEHMEDGKRGYLGMDVDVNVRYEWIVVASLFRCGCTRLQTSIIAYSYLVDIGASANISGQLHNCGTSRV